MEDRLSQKSLSERETPNEHQRERSIDRAELEGDRAARAAEEYNRERGGEIRPVARLLPGHPSSRERRRYKHSFGKISICRKGPMRRTF